MKRTFQPNVRRRKKTHGFRERMKTKGGRKVLKRRRAKGAETADRLTGRFPRRERLTSSADFQVLFQRGKRIDRPSMIVLWQATDEPRRAGFAVSRQVRGAAQRNRARRRLREAYRAIRNAAPSHTALVIIGRPGALRQPFTVLADELQGALSAIPGPRA